MHASPGRAKIEIRAQGNGRHWLTNRQSTEGAKKYTQGVPKGLFFNISLSAACRFDSSPTHCRVTVITVSGFPAALSSG
jgi:hypothetical protein